MNWAELLPEILGLILSNLYGKDVPVFRAVCRPWYSVPSPKSKHVRASEIVKYPFLLSYRNNGSEFYTPAYNKTYSSVVNAPLLGLEYAQIHSSNFGWLLLSRNSGLFFLQPVTGDVIELPQMDLPASVPLLSQMCFSAPPTSPHCMVFGIRNMICGELPDSSVQLAFIPRGDSSWRSWNHYYPNNARLTFYRYRLRGSKVKTNRCTFRPVPSKATILWTSSGSAPVFHNGAFYCLSQDGRLGVFDPMKNRSNMWRLANANNNVVSSDRDKVYLMESSRGDLISVVVGLRGEFLRMFKFDEDLKLWQGTWMMPESRHYSHQQLDWNNHLLDEEEGDIQVDPSYFIRGFNSSQHHNINYVRDTSTRMSVVTGAPIASPRLILLHEDDHHTFVDLATNVSHSDDSMMEMFRGKRVRGSTNGWILLVDYSETPGIGGNSVLLNTTSMTVDQLPTLKMPRYFVRRCCLIYQPSGSCETVVAIFGQTPTGKAMTIFCRVGDKEWTRCSGGITVARVAAYQGKIYGIAGTDLFEMELQQRHYKVTILERFELPNDNKHMGQVAFEASLVESCGELLYFERLIDDVSDTLVSTMDVRVSRVDLEGMRMEIVKDLGDRAFFFGYFAEGFGCCASESGFERNNIYFLDKCEGNVYKYDYGRHRISTVFSTKDEANDCEIYELVMFP
ncbi:F-box/kelch-repeat protein At1g57790 [Linum grandiflorum]